MGGMAEELKAAWKTPTSRPCAERVMTDLHALRRERLAFSESDVLERAHVAGLIAEMGMRAEVDALLNVFGILPGTEPGLAPILVGSHLDTVQNPGLLDGALGVFAGIECCRTLVEGGQRLRRPLVVAGFSDEEGTKSGGCLGARGCTGRLTVDEKMALADASGGLGLELSEARRRLVECLPRGTHVIADRCGPSMHSFLRMAAFLELHVEQARFLERAGVAIGTVTSIVGIRRYVVHVRGAAGHGGTLPMDARDDALQKASRLLQLIWGRLTEAGDDAIGNVGELRILPGEFNAVPEEAELSVETRAPRIDTLDELERGLRVDAKQFGGAVSILASDAPVNMDARLRRTIRQAAKKLCLPALDLSSWAGHDAAVLAPFVPTAMIFVPSEGGHSHSPLERTNVIDIQAGLEVLFETLRMVDEESDAA